MNKKYLLIFLFIALLALIYIRNQSQTRISAEEKPKEEAIKTCDYFSYNGDIVLPAIGATNPNLPNNISMAMPCLVIPNNNTNRGILNNIGIKVDLFGDISKSTEKYIIIPGVVINPGKGGDLINIPGSTKPVKQGLLDGLDFDLKLDIDMKLGSTSTNIHVTPFFNNDDGGIFGNSYPCNKPITKPKTLGSYCIMTVTLKNNETCKPPTCSDSEEGSTACIKDYYTPNPAIDITQFPNKILGITAKKISDNTFEIQTCGTIVKDEDGSSYLAINAELSKYFNSGIISGLNNDPVYGYYGGSSTLGSNINKVKIKINQEACPKKPKPIPIDDNAMGSLPNNILIPPPPAPTTF